MLLKQYCHQQEEVWGPSFRVTSPWTPNRDEDSSFWLGVLASLRVLMAQLTELCFPLAFSALVSSVCQDLNPGLGP